jgi:hypothetical protein
MRRVEGDRSDGVITSRKFMQGEQEKLLRDELWGGFKNDVCCEIS